MLNENSVRASTAHLIHATPVHGLQPPVTAFLGEKLAAQFGELKPCKQPRGIDFDLGSAAY